MPNPARATSRRLDGCALQTEDYMATLYPAQAHLSHEEGPSAETAGGDGEHRLDSRRLAAFSTLNIPFSAALMPLGVYLPALYAQTSGLSLPVIGAIFLAERIWGTFSDPLIGVLSDRTRSRFGARRVWIAAGALVMAVSGIALFFPPAHVPTAYLAAALFTFYLGLSMLYIPYLAWSGEISSGYHERTRIATYGTVAASIAMLLVLVLPTIIDQFTPQDGRLKLAAMGGVILATLAISLPLTLRAFPDVQPESVDRKERVPLLQAIRFVLGERLLLRVLVADFVVLTGQSIRSALIVFFVTAYMGRPEWASGLFLLQFIVSVAAGPIWLRIGRKMGKHRAAVTGEFIQFAINLALLTVTPSAFGWLLVLTIAQGLSQGSGNLMLKSMVADIADKHRLETGENRTALFFSAFSISMKAGIAASVGIALPLVAWLGFDPKAASNTHEALTGLLAVFALGPAIAHLIAAWLISGFSLGEAEYHAIRQQLEAREAALQPAE
jgi:Na+/melibiose symporter-like transporter